MSEKKQEICMTLARALRYKKRLVEKIGKIKSDISSCNSVIVPTDSDNIHPAVNREVDIPQLLEESVSLTTHLVELKLLFVEKNKPIQGAILELAELKGEAVFWNTIDTRHGSQLMDEYSGITLVYDAYIRKEEADKRVTVITKRIDELQEKIDTHNYHTQIKFEDYGIV